LDNDYLKELRYWAVVKYNNLKEDNLNESEFRPFHFLIKRCGYNTKKIVKYLENNDFPVDNIQKILMGIKIYKSKNSLRAKLIYHFHKIRRLSLIHIINSRIFRFFIVISIIWILLIYIRYYDIRDFILIGILPIIIFWGFIWIFFYKKD